MADHAHEYEYTGEIEREYECQVCGLKPDLFEVIRRLNATERLSAEDATYYAKHTDMLALRTYLNAYASALEGEDDLSKLTTQQKLTEEDMDAAR